MLETYASKYFSSEFVDLQTKYDGPKFDAHIHLGSLRDLGEFVKYAEEFNIKKQLGIIQGSTFKRIERKFPNKFTFAKFFQSLDLLSGNPQLIKDEIQKIYSKGYPILKFWFAPRWKDYVQEELNFKAMNIKLSDPIFEPIFSTVEELGMVFLIHICDPDLWYKLKYQPESRYGTKKSHLEDFEKVLSRYPKLKFQVAHFGAQSEDLDNLSRWFDKYPNLNVDTSSAKWVVREFSYKTKEVRDFFIKYKDRILFGTDLLTFGRQNEGGLGKYSTTRYLTYQALLETPVENLPLPFPDPENNNETKINGLDLPLDILKKIYWENAERLYKI
ncbi:MAG: amidohydrolase family protein [archaeon]|nr:amidohydrolase family protein [archaeon]